MALSNDLISQFVKATQDTTETNKETTAYGKIVVSNDIEYVQLDGSDLLTPISSTTVVKDGDRVMVTIKNHTAIVTGDLTTPSASDSDVKEIGNKISEFEIVIADKVATEQLEAEVARIDKLISDNVEATNAKFETIEGKVAEIDTIKADVVEIEGKVTANEANITTLTADIADFKDVTAESIEAIEGNFHTLDSDYADFKVTTTNKLTANEASITDLETNKLDTETAKITYANIDFSNIGEAAIEKLFSDSGIIKDLIMSDGKVTGELVGVTIKGDLIEGNTVKADKLVIQGEDGLYYKLNVNALGETTASSDEKYQNGLDGSVIVANSITAEKIAVDDLVAFGATIGGFHIDTDSIYSGVKNSIDNTTQGVFLGDDGQINIGDSNNYLKFFVDADGVYKLEIQANSIRFGASGTSIEESIANIEYNAVMSTEVEYYLSEANDFLSGGSWQTTAPTWVDGKYMWSRTKVTYMNGDIVYTPSQMGTCIAGATGATGPQGEQGIQGIQGEKGDTGATGNGISKTEVYYYLSTSSETQTGGSWSTTVPAWVDGSYYWQKIKTTYTDNTYSESTPVCITGATGATGATGSTGTGVDSITTEFYLSTSKTIQTGGSWTTTMPTWSSGKYLWTRNKIVYKNPTSTVYTTPICDSSWEAVNEIEIGGRNLWENGDFSKAMPVGNVWFQHGDGYEEIVALDEGNKTGFSYAMHTLSTDYARVRCDRFNTDSEELVGKTLTMQCWVKYSNITVGENYWNGLNIGKYALTYTFEDGTTSTSYSNIVGNTITGTSDGWVHLTGTITLRSDVSKVNIGSIWIGLETPLSGEVWVTGIKLEIGNKATDWTPAPEDVNQNITDNVIELHKVINDQRTDILATTESLILQAATDYVVTGDFESFKETVEAQLSVMSDDIIMKFTTTSDAINDLESSTSSEFETIKKYFQFNEDGLTIGSGESAIKLTLDNDEGIIFTKNGEQFGYWDGNDFYTGNIVVRVNERAQFGDYAYVPRSDTSLMFLRVK